MQVGQTTLMTDTLHLATPFFTDTQPLYGSRKSTRVSHFPLLTQNTSLPQKSLMIYASFKISLRSYGYLSLCKVPLYSGPFLHYHSFRFYIYLCFSYSGFFSTTIFLVLLRYHFAYLFRSSSISSFPLIVLLHYHSVSLISNAY